MKCELKDKKNMFEKYRDREIPEPFQTEIESRADYGESLEEKYFIAGFFTAQKIKEIRKAEGIEE